VGYSWCFLARKLPGFPGQEFARMTLKTWPGIPGLPGQV